MKVKIKILTPVHIGSGNEISPAEYLIDNEKFIRLDVDNLFKSEDFKQYINKYVKEASTGNRYIGDIIHNKEILKGYALYTVNINKSAKDYLKSHKTNVKSFIKSAGRVYIPGSSLKGSILSAIIWKKAKEKSVKEISKNLLDIILNDISNSSINKYSHWLNVTDTDLKLPVDSLELSLINLMGASTGRSIPILCETIKPGTIFTFELKTSIDSFYKFGKLSETEIINAVNEFYRVVYNKETEYKIKQELPKLQANTFLIRLGQGSTCLSTSYLILAEDLNIDKYKIFRPKVKGKKLPPIKPGEQPWTRKLISSTIPLGWCEIIL